MRVFIKLLQVTDVLNYFHLCNTGNPSLYVQDILISSMDNFIDSNPGHDWGTMNLSEKLTKYEELLNQHKNLLIFHKKSIVQLAYWHNPEPFGTGRT